MGNLQIYRLTILVCGLITRQLFKYFEHLAKTEDNTSAGGITFLKKKDVREKIEGLTTLTRQQKNLLTDSQLKDTDLDVSMLCALILGLFLSCHNKVQEKEVKTIRDIRNQWAHISSLNSVDVRQFEKLWDELTCAVLIITKQLGPSQDELDALNDDINILKETPLPKDLDKWRKDLSTDIKHLVQGTIVQECGSVLFQTEKFNPIDRLRNKFSKSSSRHYQFVNDNVKSCLTDLHSKLQKNNFIVLGGRGEDLSDDVASALANNNTLLPNKTRAGLVIMPGDIKYIDASSMDMIVVENPFGEKVFSKHATKKFIRPLEILLKDVNQGNYQVILVTPIDIFEKARRILTDEHPILTRDVFVRVKQQDTAFACVTAGPDVHVTFNKTRDPGNFEPTPLVAIASTEGGLEQSGNCVTALGVEQSNEDNRRYKDSSEGDEHDGNEAEGDKDETLGGQIKQRQKLARVQLKAPYTASFIFILCVPVVVFCLFVSFLFEWQIYKHHNVSHVENEL